MDQPDFGSSEAGKKGGKARAAKLTSEQRKAIARKGAETRWEKAGKARLPRATHEGVLKLGSLEIPCAVLENGERVLTQSGFMKALGRSRQAKGRQYYRGDVNLPAFLTAQNLKPFVPSDLEVTSSQMEFQPLKGARAFGYRAALLPKVCDVFLDAEAAGVLAENQTHIAKQAHILIRGLAHVGITALVDEATGYQYDRARDALAKILEAFVAKELQKWVSTFRLDYYENLFRLWEVPYDPFKPSMKRPQFFGKLTNNIVYSRLAPGVLQELRKRNPVNENGHRTHKHFQHLTPDLGHPKLKEHLAAVVALMRASKTKEAFMESLDVALPKYKPAPLFTGMDEPLPQLPLPPQTPPATAT